MRTSVHSRHPLGRVEWGEPAERRGRPDKPGTAVALTDTAKWLRPNLSNDAFTPRMTGAHGPAADEELPIRDNPGGSVIASGSALPPSLSSGGNDFVRRASNFRRKTRHAACDFRTPQPSDWTTHLHLSRNPTRPLSSTRRTMSGAQVPGWNLSHASLPRSTPRDGGWRCR
jgi:hypothetical protein